jgi:MscS family membrane protein
MANVTNITEAAMVNSSQAVNGLVNLNLGPLTDTTYYGNTLWQYVLFSLALIGSFIIGKLVYLFLKNRLGAKAAKTDSQVDDDIIKIAQGPAVMIIVIIGLTIGLQFLNIPGNVYTLINSALSILISVAMIWFFMRLVDIIVDVFLARKAAKSESNLDDEILPVLKKALRILVIIFGILSIASNLGYDITALIALLGVVGIGVGFAMKDTFENLISGIIIYTDRPFKIGDRIKIDDNTYGDITDIGLRSSKIKNLDNNVIILPNTKLVNAKVENYARPTKKAKKLFNIGLVYGTSPKKMEEAISIIKKAIKGTDGVTKDEPLVTFKEFGDFSLKIICIYWIKDLKYTLSAAHDINMKILKEFEKARIEMAFPTQTVYVEK